MAARWAPSHPGGFASELERSLAVRQARLLPENDPQFQLLLRALDYLHTRGAERARWRGLQGCSTLPMLWEAGGRGAAAAGCHWLLPPAAATGAPADPPRLRSAPLQCRHAPRQSSSSVSRSRAF